MTAQGEAAPRLAVAADLPVLVRLEGVAFADPWSEALLRDELAHPGSLLWVAGRAGAPQPEGYAAFRLGHGEAELLRVAVAPESRRSGLARALVAAGLERLRSVGFRLCHLEVRANNLPAIALYAGLGFERVGLRPRYYGDGTDAVLMTLGLLGSP